MGFLAHVMTRDKPSLSLEDVPVVKKFTDMFPEDLLGVTTCKGNRIHHQFTSRYRPYLLTTILNGTSGVEGIEDSTPRASG